METNKKLMQVIACLLAWLILLVLHFPARGLYLTDSEVHKSSHQVSDSYELSQNTPVTESDYISVTEEETETTKPELTQFNNKPIELCSADVKMIAIMVMAEAEGEPELGQRMVIDTIINRVLSDKFPNTVSQVIFQANAFESLSNNRYQKCIKLMTNPNTEVTEYLTGLVREECKVRTSDTCIFFQAYGFSPYGIPMYQVGNHFFSGIEKENHD